MTIERDITQRARKYLANDQIMLFTGPRQAGKTTILKQIKEGLEKDKQTCHFLNLEDPDYLTLLNETPKNLFKILTLDLEKRNFVFVDEIQYLINPTNFLKFLYDEYRGKLKLIVSGSSAFYLDEKFKDSLAGRKMIFEVRTLSFHEFLRFQNEDSLVNLLPLEFSEKNFSPRVSLQERERLLLRYREYVTFGGYPRVVLSPLEEKEDTLRELAYSFIKKDIHEAGVRKDELFYKLIKILAGQVGNLVNVQELANSLGASKTLIANYIHVMQKSYHVVLITPFSRNVRKELTKMPKIYFMDLGLRNFFVNNYGPVDFRQDKGALLENAVFRQFLNWFYPQDIKFWRTTDQHEVDFVVREAYAVEVKYDIKKFKRREMDRFLNAYPTMKYYLATMDAVPADAAHGPMDLIESWAI